jgi:hypothetical protein
MEFDTPLEEKWSSISESIHGFHMKITNLEARQTPNTPSEEREKREKMVTKTVENIKRLEAEYAKLYE